MPRFNHFKPSQLSPVIIIGAHRSGTTATTRALEILGLQLGQQLDSHEEPRELRAVHDRYLQQLGASWHNPRPFLDKLAIAEDFERCSTYLRDNVERDFPRLFGYRRNLFGLGGAKLRLEKPWGWKEPRTTLFARCWLDIFPSARVVHIIRHPLAVATSIQRRELDFQAKGDAPTGRVHDFAYCLDLAITYMDAGVWMESEAKHYRRVRFEDIQADPIATLSSLAVFCGLTFAVAEMEQGAATIRADKAKGWRNLPNARELLARYPSAAAFGYGA